MALRIGVIGCGPAGQAASIFLSRAGHRVTAFEQAPRDEPVGAGLLIQPTGQRVLRELDILEPIASLAAPIARLEGKTHRGRLVMDLRYRDLREDLLGLGVQRAALSRILLEGVRDAGAEILFGTPIRSIESRSGAELRVECASGRAHGPFDLLIVADGARSPLREQTNLARRARRYAWGALWGIVDLPPSADPCTLAQVYRGSARMVGVLPSGRLNDRVPEQISLFWSVRADAHDPSADLDLGAWKDEVRTLTHRLDDLLDQIDDPRALIFAPYYDVSLRTSSAGRAIFIGDAAHATSPQLGQGVNLALVDALVLAQSIEASASVEAALDRFARARGRQIRYYQFASRWLMPFFQSGLEPLAWPRDLLGHAMCRFPPLRRQMLLTLAGVKTGLASAEPLPHLDDVPARPAPARN